MCAGRRELSLTAFGRTILLARARPTRDAGPDMPNRLKTSGEQQQQKRLRVAATSINKCHTSVQPQTAMSILFKAVALGAIVCFAHVCAQVEYETAASNHNRGGYSYGGGGGNGGYGEQDERPKVHLGLRLRIPAFKFELPRMSLPKITIHAKIRQPERPRVINLPEINLDTSSKVSPPSGKMMSSGYGGSGYGSGGGYGGGGGGGDQTFTFSTGVNSSGQSYGQVSNGDSYQSSNNHQQRNQHHMYQQQQPRHPMRNSGYSSTNMQPAFAEPPQQPQTVQMASNYQPHPYQSMMTSTNSYNFQPAQYMYNAHSMPQQQLYQEQQMQQPSYHSSQMPAQAGYGDRMIKSATSNYVQQQASLKQSTHDADATPAASDFEYEETSRHE